MGGELGTIRRVKTLVRPVPSTNPAPTYPHPSHHAHNGSHPLASSEVATNGRRGETGWLGRRLQPGRDTGFRGRATLLPAPDPSPGQFRPSGAERVGGCFPRGKAKGPHARVKSRRKPMVRAQNPDRVARLRPHINAEYPLRGRSLAAPLFEAAPTSYPPGPPDASARPFSRAAGFLYLERSQGTVPPGGRFQINASSDRTCAIDGRDGAAKGELP